LLSRVHVHTSVKKSFIDNRAAVNGADAILTLSCGNGAQAVRETMRKTIYPGTNTIFTGWKLHSANSSKNVYNAAIATWAGQMEYAHLLSAQKVWQMAPVAARRMVNAKWTQSATADGYLYIKG